MSINILLHGNWRLAKINSFHNFTIQDLWVFKCLTLWLSVKFTVLPSFNIIREWRVEKANLRELIKNVANSFAGLRVEM